MIVRGTDLNAKHIKETKCGHNIDLNRIDLAGTHGLLQLLEGQHAGHAGFLLLSKLRPREARPRAGGLSKRWPASNLADRLFLCTYQRLPLCDQLADRRTLEALVLAREPDNCGQDKEAN